MLYQPEDLILCPTCKLHLDDMSQIEHISTADLELFKNPERAMTVNFPVRMDDGSTKQVTGFRVQYSTALGPAKGGIRIHQDVDFHEVSELAFLMALKTALVGLPYGGGKGGIKLDPKHLSEGELERVARGYIRALGEFIGPDKDIPAPDVNTNPKIMGWMLDEFEALMGHKAPGVITGKPLSMGGSKGRDTATARGGFFILQEKYAHGDVCTYSVAIQGFGNAGLHIAEMLHQAGFSIVAVSDSSGGLYQKEGLPISELMEFKTKGGKLANWSGEATQISNEELLTLPVDILIPAALGGVITEQNAAQIQAPTILELANGPITTPADKMLEAKNIEVIPGILANAGGVIVSYFEWVQNLQNFYWTGDEVDSRLQEMIRKAYAAVREEQEKFGGSLRTASTSLALRRIIEAQRLRGHLS